MKVILYHPYEGLGDSLQFSHLPEIFASRGYKFYISSRIRYRNADVKKLVWEMNPFVEGESDEEPNIGTMISFDEHPRGGNICNRWLSTHNLPFTPEAVINPRIYYKPQFREEFTDKVVGDFSAFHCKQYYNNPIDCIWDNKGQIIQMKNEYINSFQNLDLSYSPRDIFEYIDIISSAKRFWCFLSGANSVAAGLGLRNTHCILPANKMFSFEEYQDGYIFSNITYYNSI